MFSQFRALAIVVVVLFAAAPIAAQEPADSAIKGALADIERFEPQVGALTPNQKAGINRVQKLLKLTEERLASSTNQSDPSWIAANERLTALQQALEDLAAGRMPGTAAADPAAPATEAPAETPTETAAPATASDPIIAAAQQEIARIDEATGETQPSNFDQVKQLRNELNAVADRLNAVNNKSGPDFAAAAKAYNATNAKLNELIDAANASPGAAGPDPNVQRAMRELDLIARQAETMQPGDARLGARFLTDLERIGQQLAAVPDQTQPSWSEAVARHAEIKGAIVQKRAEGLQGDLAKLAERADSLQPLQYLVAENVGAVRQDLSNIRAGLEALASPEHPAVQALAANVAAVSEVFEGQVQTAEAEHAKLGDVQGQLAQVHQRAREIAVPQPLMAPVSEADVQAYVAAVQAVQKHVAEDLAYLQSVEGKTPLTVEEGNAFRFTMNELAYGKPRNLQDSLMQSTFTVDAGVDEALRLVDFFADTDPADPSHQANRLLGKGIFEENMARLAAGRESIRVAAAYDTALGRGDAPDRKAQLARLEEAIASFEDKHRIALDTIRMPEAKSEDAELLETAAAVLKDPQYGYNFERVVINMDLRRNEKTTGDISDASVSASGTVTASVTMYHYVWDEYQVTTAEKDGDAYYLYFNRLRYYHEAAPTTPVKQWLLVDRFQSSQILEENIHKD